MLDSGANGAVLFNTSEYLDQPQRHYLQGTGVDGRRLIFSSLLPQDVKIGSLKLSRVPFVSLAGTQKDSRQGVRWHPDVRALPARVCCPRRSLGRPRAAIMEKTAGSDWDIEPYVFGKWPYTGFADM
jgi:hypothetical protein